MTNPYSAPESNLSSPKPVIETKPNVALRCSFDSRPHADSSSSTFGIGERVVAPETAERES